MPDTRPHPTDDVLSALERYGAAVESSIEPVAHDPDLVVLAFPEQGRRGSLPLILTVAAALLVGLFIGRLSREDPTIRTSSSPPVTLPGDLPLAGPRWVLQTTDGRTLYPGRAAPFLILGDAVTENGMPIYGKDYCRSFINSYRMDGNVLHLGILSPNTAECAPPAGMALISPTLPSGDATYAIRGTTLTVSFGGHTLVYLATEASRDGENPVAAMPDGASTSPMHATVHGDVTYDEASRCVDVRGRPAVWPAGTTWQQDPPAVVLADGTAIPVGATVTADGGEVPSEVLDPTVAEVLRQCLQSAPEVLVLQSGVKVTPPEQTSATSAPAG